MFPLSGSGSLLDGFDDSRMRAAAADVALQGLLNFGLRGIGILLQQSDAAHDHAGRAVGALEGFGVEEGLLNRMKAAGLLEAFDGGNGFAVGCGNGSYARTTRRTIEQNCAGAALAFAAAVFGASKTEVVAKDS